MVRTLRSDPGLIAAGGGYSYVLEGVRHELPVRQCAYSVVEGREPGNNEVKACTKVVVETQFEDPSGTRAIRLEMMPFFAKKNRSWLRALRLRLRRAYLLPELEPDRRHSHVRRTATRRR